LREQATHPLREIKMMSPIRRSFVSNAAAEAAEDGSAGVNDCSFAAD
jgi:hypothetical protein